MHKLVSKLASQQIVLYGRKCWITCKTGSDVRKQLLLSDACWVVHGHLAFWWRFQVWPGRLDQEWLYIRTKKRRALDPQLMNCYIHISFPEFKPSPVELSHTYFAFLHGPCSGRHAMGFKRKHSAALRSAVDQNLFNGVASKVLEGFGKQSWEQIFHTYFVNCL